MTPSIPLTQSAPVAVLTDGTGVSPFNWQKVLKDFVADALISGAAALASANILSVQSAVQGPQVAGFALAGAVIHALYRSVLRWATTD
jgi:hypothetical protein